MKAKSVGEALAALGVIASLVFVAFEIRQNTVALRAAAYQSIDLSGASTLGEVAHDRDFLENAFAKAPGEMDRVDWWQFQRHMASLARTCETLQLQVVERALPEDAMERLGCNGWRTIFDDPKTACVWPTISPWVSSTFREYVEEGQDSDSFDCSGYAIPQTPFGPS